MRDKYWIEVMFENTDIAELSVDGQLYRFEANKIASLLKDLPRDKYGWFFNNTRDRYCAEWEGSYIVVNPAKVSELFGIPVIYGD